MRVLAAVSGGVDSAVALARAVDAGHDVVAVHLALNSDRAATREGSRGCCTLSDAHDARRAADVVGVPFYVWNVAGDFRERVIDDFVSEYEAGRTPNPCIRCNEHIKFAAVLDKATALGFDAVVTGHYAQLHQSATGPILRRSVDNAKDQSYVLAVLGNDRLRKCMFPVGDTDKTEIRAEAKERGLTVAAKPDSHDICFIPDGDTAGFLARRLGEQPGPIIDEASGAQIGEHSGTYGFTIGQRKGIAVDQPAPSGRPRYVLGIEPVSRTVVVGERERLAVSTIRADQPVWPGNPPAPGQEVLVQVRAHAEPVPARVETADRFAFELDVLGELFALAPGQSCVLYDAERVIGQGTVTP
ncbi:MAG: tRNA 2-thiouridine(34) synthase MnmA [Actinomycetia bacterium]|nr:tRNA 2-thiouridine(34) synthase MnmA [Actinomycetes bacterium]